MSDEGYTEGEGAWLGTYEPTGPHNEGAWQDGGWQDGGHVEPAGQPQGDALTRQDFEQLLTDRDQATFEAHHHQQQLMEAQQQQAQLVEQATEELSGTLETLRSRFGFGADSEEEEDILDVASGLLGRNPELGLTAVEKAAERYYRSAAAHGPGPTTSRDVRRAVASRVNGPPPEIEARPPGPRSRDAAQAAAQARLRAAFEGTRG